MITFNIKSTNKDLGLFDFFKIAKKANERLEDIEEIFEMASRDTADRLLFYRTILKKELVIIASIF